MIYIAALILSAIVILIACSELVLLLWRPAVAVVAMALLVWFFAHSMRAIGPKILLMPPDVAFWGPTFPVFAFLGWLVWREIAKLRH